MPLLTSTSAKRSFARRFVRRFVSKGIKSSCVGDALNTEGEVAKQSNLNQRSCKSFDYVKISLVPSVQSQATLVLICIIFDLHLMPLPLPLPLPEGHGHGHRHLCPLLAPEGARAKGTNRCTNL